MPSTLISLCGPDRSFRVQYGDFFTAVHGELRNTKRLHYAVLVTAGASMEEAEFIDDPFGDCWVFPDEARCYFHYRMPGNGANCAALLATGFRWTSEAASAAKEYRIAAAVVAQVRLAIEKLHREDMALWGRCTEESRKLLAQHEARARGLVNWQAMAQPPWDSSFWSSVERAQGLVNWHTMAAQEYEIPPAYIVASPEAEVEKRRKLCWTTNPAGRQRLGRVFIGWLRKALFLRE
jgi:hypothetical protein